MSLTDNISKPAPQWFRITKKVLANAENLVIGVLLITGHGDNSQAMLIYKVVSSFVMSTLDSILTNGQEYAQAGTTQALENVTNLPAATAIEKHT